MNRTLTVGNRIYEFLLFAYPRQFRREYGPEMASYRGVPPYYETRAYVAKIVRDFNRKKIAERKAAAATAQSSRTRTVSQRAGTVKQGLFPIWHRRLRA